MLNRVMSLLLAASLSATAPPNGNTATTNATAYVPPRQPSLRLTQTRVEQAGSTVLALSGQYQAAGGIVNLRSTVTKTKVDLIVTPPRNSIEEIEQERVPDYDPGADQYSSYAEMTRPDGTQIVQASYEYQGQRRGHCPNHPRRGHGRLRP